LTMDLPATDLRKNVLTLAVPDERLPGVGRMMRSLLPSEEYDPDFLGQYLQTTYFDTPQLALRKARLDKDKYCTVRIRCYAPTQQPGRNYPEGIYALSIKTCSRRRTTGGDSPGVFSRCASWRAGHGGRGNSWKNRCVLGNSTSYAVG
jgi:hypothetical protein